MKGIRQMGFLADLAVRGFNHDIVALLNIVLPGGFGMDFHLRVRSQLSQFFQPPVGRMQIITALGAGQNQGVFRIVILRQTLIFRQRAELEFFGRAEHQLHLARRGTKPLFLILPEAVRTLEIALFAKLAVSQAAGFDDVFQELVIVIIPVFRRGHEFPQLIHDFHIRPALLRGIDNLGTGQDITVADA